MERTSDDLKAELTAQKAAYRGLSIAEGKRELIRKQAEVAAAQKAERKRRDSRSYAIGRRAYAAGVGDVDLELFDVLFEEFALRQGLVTRDLDALLLDEKKVAVDAD